MRESTALRDENGVFASLESYGRAQRRKVRQYGVQRQNVRDTVVSILTKVDTRISPRVKVKNTRELYGIFFYGQSIREMHVDHVTISTIVI